MIQYLVIAALAAALGFGAYDRYNIVSRERHRCTQEIVQMAGEISNEAMDQIAQAKKLADDLIIPADLGVLCRSDPRCRDR